jgi:hypothetical protein
MMSAHVNFLLPAVADMRAATSETIQRMLQSARDLDASANKMAKEHDEHARKGFGQSIAAAVASKVSRPRAAIFATASKAPKAEAENFGQRLAQAVKRQQSPCVFAAAPRKDSDDDNDDENGDKEEKDSFGKRIKKAVEKQSGQKQHKEYAERERRRYQQPRPAPKSV